MEQCSQCHGVGACPKCWGRSAINELKSDVVKLAKENQVLLELMEFARARCHGYAAALQVSKDTGQNIDLEVIKAGLQEINKKFSKVISKEIEVESK